jgi:3-oxoacyl-[acyl-carrier-protein] synthase II
MRRVVVTGMGMLSPVGNTVAESWENVLAAKSGIGPITQFDPGRIQVKVAGEVKGFNPSAFMDAKEARRTTRFIQLAVAAAKEALDQAGVNEDTNKVRFGVSIGVGMGGISWTCENTLISKEKDPSRVSPFFIPYAIPNMAAGIVANAYGLKGPNICTTTACTSGTHGVGEAFLLIRSGMADGMIAGGAESAICELSVAAFANMKALCVDADAGEKSSRPFDENRSGFVMGEGAGFLVLEELEHAKKRGAKILAEMVGYGMSGDAYHITSPAPEGEGAQRCMKMALDMAEITPDKMNYINAHGTSTELNDLYETRAIEHVFGTHAKKVAVSSTKGVTGHLLGGAGGVEAVFTVKAIMDQVAPPTANLETPDPALTLDYVPLKARPMAIEYAMSNSFGFGGTNGSVLFKKYKA